MPLELLELETLPFRMEALARRAPNEWERTFARSILRHAKRPTWRPTARQEQVMRRMADSLFRADPAPILIEEEERASA